MNLILWEYKGELVLQSTCSPVLLTVLWCDLLVMVMVGNPGISGHISDNRGWSMICCCGCCWQ